MFGSCAAATRCSEQEFCLDSGEKCVDVGISEGLNFCIVNK